VSIANSDSMGTVGTAKAARRLLDVVEQLHLRVSFIWTPRELLDAEDAASRMASVCADRARLPQQLMQEIWDYAWGGRPPTIDAFADAGNRVCNVWGCRLPDPASCGDGLDLDYNTAGSRIWCFPPFALSRPFLSRVAGLRTLPCMIAVLPDCSLTRLSLRGWTFLSGVVSLTMPPDYVRESRPSVPLVVCVSPACDVGTLAASSGMKTHP
jgi:hypothetical protein